MQQTYFGLNLLPMHHLIVCFITSMVEVKSSESSFGLKKELLHQIFLILF